MKILPENNYLISLPHSGTRTLATKLGLPYETRGNGNPIIPTEDVMHGHHVRSSLTIAKIITPVRHPLSIVLSVLRRRKDTVLYWDRILRMEELITTYPTTIVPVDILQLRDERLKEYGIHTDIPWSIEGHVEKLAPWDRDGACLLGNIIAKDLTLFEDYL